MHCTKQFSKQPTQTGRNSIWVEGIWNEQHVPLTLKRDNCFVFNEGPIMDLFFGKEDVCGKGPQCRGAK